MAQCEVCHNEYDKAFEVIAAGEAHGQFFCCASCARMAGETGLKDRAA